MVSNLVKPVELDSKSSSWNEALSNVLPKNEVLRWRSEGYCLVNGLHPKNLIEKAKEECYQVVNESYFGNETRVFGSAGKLEFPSLSDALNHVIVHPRLIHSVAQLLGTKEFILCQADAWAKTGVEKSNNRDYFSNIDQRMHMDFPNHDLNHPPPFECPEVVAVIIYFDDAEGRDGRTGLVPRTGTDDELYSYPYYRMPGFGAIPWINDKEQAEEYIKGKDVEMFEFREKLYKREAFADYNVGTVLFYRHDIWHRGRPLLPNETRLVCNLVFKKSFNVRINHWSTGFARQFYNIKAILNRVTAEMEVPRVGNVEQFFVKLSPFQRSVLGFPAPGDEYWNEQTLEAAKYRWGVLGMDLTPYIQAQVSNRIT